MISRRLIFEVHRLKDKGFSQRMIANTLHMDRGTVAKYIQNPDIPRKQNTLRSSKLDPYRAAIKEMVEQYPRINAPVVMRHIEAQGFEGKITIVRDYLRVLKQDMVSRQAFIRFESDPGQQMQVDWGHFGSLVYNQTSRKLYALAVIESHSRMLHVSFTHSQKQAVLHQCLVDAFRYFGGTPRELVVDNMVTAVHERVGSIVRFNDAFLDFLRPLGITPVACNVRAPYEKGKIENSIRYLRNNFWPLKEFENLEDVQRQVRVWLDCTANKRMHQTTGQQPILRLQPDALTPLCHPLQDFRETETLKVYKDFGIRFDANVYTVPPRLVGKTVTLKADNKTVTIYYKDKKVATHARTWERGHRVELASHKEQVRKLKKRVLMDRQMRVFMSLGQDAVDYIEKLSDASQPLKKTVDGLLALQDIYGSAALMTAVKKALEHKLYALEYVQNLLDQQRIPQKQYPPVTLKNNELNDIRLPVSNLADYDAIAIKKRGENGPRY